MKNCNYDRYNQSQEAQKRWQAIYAEGGEGCNIHTY